MERRDFLKATGLTLVAASVGIGTMMPEVPTTIEVDQVSYVTIRPGDVLYIDGEAFITTGVYTCLEGRPSVNIELMSKDTWTIEGPLGKTRGCRKTARLEAAL